MVPLLNSLNDEEKEIDVKRCAPNSYNILTGDVSTTLALPKTAIVGIYIGRNKNVPIDSDVRILTCVQVLTTQFKVDSLLESDSLFVKIDMSRTTQNGIGRDIRVLDYNKDITIIEKISEGATSKVWLLVFMLAHPAIR